jgi:hypothetical protein
MRLANIQSHTVAAGRGLSPTGLPSYMYGKQLNNKALPKVSDRPHPAVREAAPEP